LEENLRLTLSKEKTLITKASTKSARFLGTRISRLAPVRGQILNKKNGKGHRVRIKSTSTIMKAPIKDIIVRLIDKDMAGYKLNRIGVKIVVGKPIIK